MFVRSRWLLAALPIAVLWLSACSPAATTAPPPPLPLTPGPAPTEAPETWQNQDLNQDGVPGTSTDRALRELLGDRQPQRTVVVAVIDGGVDTAHVDLVDALWHNPGETAGNGRDDDGNGYVDDVYGWNFIGGADGRNVNHATSELTRLYAQCEQGVTPGDYDCVEITQTYKEKWAEHEQMEKQVEQIETTLTVITPMLQQAAGVEELTPDVVRAVQSSDERVQQARDVWLQLTAAGISPEYMVLLQEEVSAQGDYGLNPQFDSRSVVGDDPSNGEERLYGNRDVTGPDASHGTHVAGIIAAERGNGVGMDGVASPNVRIMAIRAVPNGDEWDKDVANAIRYAVDQGADIINMSFGKGYSPDKQLVDAAVRYADEHGVLMLHAAGNDGDNLEIVEVFPSPTYEDGGRASLWITIGASDWKVDSLAAPFSNYGQTKVDVFAPGVDILSTVPGGGWDRKNGTSMATPVASGVAALLMAYFPELTAADVRRILVESSVDYSDRMVPPPGDPADPVAFGTLSVSGAVVNTYEAVRMALEMSGD